MNKLTGIFSLAMAITFGGCSSEFLKQTDFFDIQTLKEPSGVSFAISGSQALTAGDCAAYTITLLTGEQAGVDLFASEGGFFLNSQCTLPTTETVLSRATPNATIYYRSEQATNQGIITVQDKASNASKSYNLVVNAGPATQATLTAPSSAVSGQNFAAFAQFFDQFLNPTIKTGQIQLEYRTSGSTGSYQSLQVVNSTSSQVNFPSVAITLSGPNITTYELRARELNATSPIITPLRQISVAPGQATQVLLDQIGGNLLTSQSYSARVRVRDGSGSPSSALIELLVVTPGYNGFTRVEQNCTDVCIIGNLQFTQPATSIDLRAQIVGNPNIGTTVTGISVTDNVPASIVINNASFGDTTVTVSETRSLQLTVFNAAQQPVPGTVELLVNGYNGFAPRTQSCGSGPCTFNNLQFTQVTPPSTTITLTARIQGNNSVNDQITGITVTNPLIRLAKEVILGEPAFFDLLRDPTAASNDALVHWDFGDGNTATGRVQAHYYTSASTFTVTARVQTPQGMSSPATLVHTVRPYSDLPNKTNIWVSATGTAAGGSSSANNPTTWDQAVARLATIQTNANGAPRAIRIFVLRGSVIPVTENERLILNGTGRVTVEAYHPTQPTLPNPIFVYTTSTTDEFISGIQDGLVLRNIAFTGSLGFDRNNPGNPYAGSNVYVKVEGDDHFFHNVQFNEGAYGIVGHMVGMSQNQRPNRYYDFQRKLVLGCTFSNFIASAVMEFGATYVGIQDSTFDYSAILENAQIAESKRAIIENNTFSTNSTFQGNQSNGLDFGGLNIVSYKGTTNGPTVQDIVIQDNDFYNNAVGISLIGNRTDQKIDNVWIKRNTIRSDDGLNYFTKYTQAGVRLTGVRNALIQNNVFSVLNSPTFTALYTQGDTVNSAMFRHNSIFSSGEKANMVSALALMQNFSVYANNVKYPNLTTTNPTFIPVPLGVLNEPTVSSGVFDFKAMNDSQVQSNVTDGDSVIDITGPLNWYFTMTMARNRAGWVAFGKGANDALAPPLYSNPQNHDLRINIGSPAIDRTGVDPVYLENDRDPRLDGNADSGAFEAEDLGGGGGSGGGEPIITSSGTALRPFLE